MDIQTWHGVLEGHHSLLNKHLETISLMQQNLQDGSDAAQMLQSCVNQTEAALQTFKVAAYRFMAELHSQALPQPMHNNAPTTPTGGGVSGPTPAEQVQQSRSVRRTVIGTKRNAAAEEPTPAQPSISFTSRPLKRARATIVRRSVTATPQTCQVTASPQPPGATVEEDCEGGDDGGNGNDNADNGDDDDISYLEAVEAKLKEKEEKMWKRMVKKRKRSPSDIDGVSQEQTKTPLLAKLRKKTLLAASKVDDNNIEESAHKSQSGKLSNDPPSWTTGHVEQNLPRACAKRPGVTRSRGTVTG